MTSARLLRNARLEYSPVSQNELYTFSLAYTWGNIDVDDLDGDAEKANTVDSWDYYYITFGFGEILGLDTSITYHSAPGYKGDAGQEGFFVSLGHEW